MRAIRNHLKKTIAGIAFGLLSVPVLLHAQPSAHYFPGTEGIKAATLPPPGIYLRDYNLFYYSDQANDANGDKISGADPGLTIYANAPRLIWITDIKLFGGYLGVDALVPLQYTDLDVANESTFGVGDVFGEATWSAHGDQFDVALGFGIWGPTGDTSATDPTEPGLGYWTYMFTGGATFYLDPEKLWSVSALNRYEINGEKDNSDFTAGQVWTIEGGVAYTLGKTMDLGVAAYYQRQTTDDENGANSDLASVAGVGPEISGFYPRITFGWSLRYLYEFMAEDRCQGHTVAFTLTKRF
jgi:hypothetical protein